MAYEVMVMIGVPGSGKSTKAKILALASEEIVSPDEIRKELYGNISIQGNGKEVFDLAYRRIEDLLKNGKDVIFDATNCVNRKETVRKLRRCGAKYVSGYFINTPLDVCLKRNKNRRDRETPVPDEVIYRMYTNLMAGIGELVTTDGFDEVVAIKG